MSTHPDIRIVRETARTQDGLTLVELMVVSGLLVFVLGTAFMAFNTASTMSDGIQAREQASSTSALALERITAEMRQARALTSAGFAFKTTAADRAVFYVDLDHADAPVRVTYYVSSGALYRSEARSTLFSPTDADYVESPARLIVHLDPTWTTIFTYYDNGSGNYSSFVTPVVVTSPGLTTAVKITIKSKVTVGASTMTGQSSSMVNIRSTNIILNGS